MGGGEKTEQATSKRKRDERRKGNVFKSQEVGTLLGLVGIVYSLQFAGTLIISSIQGGFRWFWSIASTQYTINDAILRTTFIQGAIAFISAAGIPLIASILIAIAVTMAQTKGLVSFEKLKPKFDKMNPLNGIKRMFSMRGAVELVKSILKILILGYVIYTKYIEYLPGLPRLMEMEYTNSLSYAAVFFMDLIVDVAVVFAFLAAADYFYQRWQYEKDLRMTKQEVKEEYKQMEGDPHIKSQIKQKQREMSMGRMMENVPEADVVIRNPTHYAVAIRYETGKNKAPLVIAKGADYVALRIIKKAEESKVTIVENKPLARGIYENVPLDAEISEQFFAAVAEVLAFVYSTAKKDKNPLLKKH